MLGLAFNMEELEVKTPTPDEAILLISRQQCLGSKYLPDQNGARGFSKALGNLFNETRKKIAQPQKNKVAITTLLPWLNASFVSAPKSKPTPRVSVEQPAPVASPGPEDDTEMMDAAATITDLTTDSEMQGLVIALPILLVAICMDKKIVPAKVGHM